MNDPFGPWTTAISSGSNARLSTFWKRRMAMLPTVRESSADMTRRGRVLLAVTAVCAVALPTTYVSRVAPAVEEVEAAPEKLAAAGEPFRAKLPGGVIVELIGVGRNPSKGQTWWAADGTTISAPYERINETLRYNTGAYSREIAVRWIHAPEDVTVRLTPNSNSWYGSCRAFDADGKEVPGVQVMAAHVLKSENECRLSFKIGAGPWETLTETPGRGYVTYNAGSHGYAVSHAMEIDGDTHITISHDILDRDVRIVAVDHDGHEITTQDRGGGAVKGFAQQTMIFRDVPLKTIKAFRVQARDWQEGAITGIALNPGERTKPAVEHKTSEGGPRL